MGESERLGQVGRALGRDKRAACSRIASMAALTISLFVSCTEIDLPAAISQAEEAISARRAAGHPSTYAMFRDHSHISQNYPIGTADTSVSAPILEFIHQLE